MRIAELTVVRHGESNWNLEGRQQGHLDSGLSERGKKQAEAIADRLSKQSFGALYSSDLGRAYQTAETIAKRTGHTVTAEPRLRERHLGIFQGLTWPEIESKYREEFIRFGSGDPDYVIPGGESARQRYERTIPCLREIASKHPGQSIVIITHGGSLMGC